MKNQMDSRNRDAKAIVSDLAAERGCLVVVGSHKLDPAATAEALRASWKPIVRMVGFEPTRIVTGCAAGGAEKAARLAARSLTGKPAAVFHRPDITHGSKQAEMFLNILLSRTGNAGLILATSAKPACVNFRRSMVEWGKKFYQVEVG